MSRIDTISSHASEELAAHCSISYNRPLSLYTTFKTGGVSDILIEPFNDDSIPAIVSVIRNEQIPFNVIGGGSNLLISDRGLRGITLKISGFDGNGRFEVRDGLIYAGASLSKEVFISKAMETGFGGVEFMAGIPGSVGGGIFMNAGTYMGCFSDILKKITGVMSNGEHLEIEVSGDVSGYRKMELPEGLIITGGIFSLPAGDTDELKRCVNDIINDRWSKHPMEFPSAGSVFKNPEGQSSWKLVNDSGLKGCRIGGAMVSEKHTNFIINSGDATSEDILNLIRHVQETVLKKTGIFLETEIKIMGEF